MPVFGFQSLQQRAQRNGVPQAEQTVNIQKRAVRKLQPGNARAGKQALDAFFYDFGILAEIRIRFIGGTT